MAVVRNTRSPQMAGHEWPSPGIGVFQRTFVPSLMFQVVGGCWPSARPVQSGPRNPGQLSGAATTVSDLSCGTAATFGAGLDSERKKLISAVNRLTIIR